LATSFSIVDAESVGAEFSSVGVVDFASVGAAFESDFSAPDLSFALDRRGSVLDPDLSAGADGCDADDGGFDPRDDDDEESWSRPDGAALSLRDVGRIESDSTEPNDEFPGSEPPGVRSLVVSFLVDFPEGTGPTPPGKRSIPAMI
jgi:hypothetical protein